MQLTRSRKMKKLLILLITVVFGFAAFSQTTPTEVTPDAYLTDASYTYVWGTTADTLTNADTLNFVYRMKGYEAPDLTIKLYSDFVSGTAGGTLTVYSSIDGVNYAAVDSITVSALTEDGMDTEVISITDYMYPYLKFEYLQTGTAVTIPRAYLYAKFN